MAAKRQDELESQRAAEKAKKLEAIKKTSQSSPVFAVRAACFGVLPSGLASRVCLRGATLRGPS